MASYGIAFATGTLQFFAGLGNRQVIAGYYDSDLTLVTNWLSAATPYTGICGVVYTTWQNNYSDLETFEQIVTNYPAPSRWLTPGSALGFSAATLNSCSRASADTST